MKSIGFKLWAGMMALVMMVLILLWLFQIVFLESFYTRMRISDVKNQGASIAKLLYDGSRAEFKDKLDAFAFNNNLNIELLDLDRNSIYTTDSTSMHIPMQRNIARAEAFQAVLSGKEVTIPLTHPRFGYEFMLLGLPVKQSGALSAVMLINMPLAPVEDTALILKWQLFYITLVLLTAALLLSFFLSRSFTRPILEIKKVSETMASGDFSARIKSNKQDEIGKLAETINYLGQQLAKIEQLRKDLISNISHELRTPLSIIRGYAETIRDVSGNAPEKREKQLGMIIEETERLSEIVDDILNLSQLQAGYARLNKSRFPIKDVLDTVIKRYDVISEKTGVQIILQDSKHALVEADEKRIEQVFYNLINNGIKHTPPGGTVTVKVIDHLQVVRVEVTDTGSGIAEEDLPHIWDRYYKAKKTAGKNVLGTGLGLAIVKSVLEAHQAPYGVESKKGAGTTFWFELQK
ncbi:Alkaline phosphatase synthesis sensor protein PhoR [Pelotomaculum schinkii]|uniref:histidine kinase n=1 Tax=Pelotomaculum schinkii TaxID=78350 RepID=A0A4Y7R6M0_9FIRM|nr:MULTISPECIES: ATP-binding protein [Pelotomaculum]TEB04413.1 Alkaline phosphatase synthesis sensor protein PhoR [Pelotomaculum schinkii]TEB15261.1 Alkaline phosphatase synthesis sensor protein PhoR [Pelotomaculum sp. FP]